MTQKNFLFLGGEEDRPYLMFLKPLMGDNKCYVQTGKITTLIEVEHYCKQRDITGVFTTSLTALRKLTGREKVSINNYAGSYFKRNDLEWVILDPLEHTQTVPYGKFLLARYISKLTKPENWLPAPAFSWSLITESNYTQAIEDITTATIAGVDIETFSDPLSIRCIGFTGVHVSASGDIQTKSYVIPMDSIWAVAICRMLLSSKVPKVFQNGKYDNSYLLRYGIIVENWLYDTATMMHSWYSELPKDLGFLQSFFVREASYWKDLAESNDLHEYYKYNAKDTWATVLAAIAWMLEAPEWAVRNYRMEFPLNFACMMAEMTGIKHDVEQMEISGKIVDEMVEVRNASLNKMLGTQNFNVNSTVHMRKLLDTLGCKDVHSAGDKELAKVIFRHPLNARLIGVIRGVPKSDDPNRMGIRALRKVRSTYLKADKSFRGRILYALNPHGTDSGRLASREHHFWCGLQLQNVPAGQLVKSTLVADDGFYFGECDLEQAETRDTAYITGDKNLIAAVTSGRDFHSSNTSAFFGVPYEEIYDDELGKTLNKPLRDLAKRVNHGANYNMGAKVMVDTMGEEKIYEAAKLLRLAPGLSAEAIAKELLDRFAKTYPVVRYNYQQWIISTVVSTSMLIGATGWTRYCFSDPRKAKPVLNTYISHPPQSLNAMVLNKAFMRVFLEMSLNPEIAPHFRLLGQIHDSIPFLYREGHEYIPRMVKDRMEIPVTISDIEGIERTFTVPAALKIGKIDKNGNFIRARRWSETE